MSLFIAVDGDGTCENFGGPVPLFLLRRLGQEHRVMVIGNHALQSFGFDGVKVNGLPVSGLAYGKSKKLREWRIEFPGHDEYIVVDDSPAQYTEGWEGWTFLTPHQFILRFAT